MSALSYTVTDSATMLRRNLRRLLHYPSMTLLLVGMPIVFLLLASIAIVLGVAVALGFHPTADAADWLAAIGVLLLFTLALIWLATALGLAAKSVETASNTPMFLTLLPFLSSAFVPADTMPAGLRQFATYQPFTPATETVRGLLTGTAIGGNAIGAIAWSVGISVASYLWARQLYAHRHAR